MPSVESMYMARCRTVIARSCWSLLMGMADMNVPTMYTSHVYKPCIQAPRSGSTSHKVILMYVRVLNDIEGSKPLQCHGFGINICWRPSVLQITTGNSSWVPTLVAQTFWCSPIHFNTVTQLENWRALPVAPSGPRSTRRNSRPATESATCCPANSSKLPIQFPKNWKALNWVKPLTLSHSLTLSRLSIYQSCQILHLNTLENKWRVFNDKTYNIHIN